MTVVTSEAWTRELAARREAVWNIARAQNCDVLLMFGSMGHMDPFRYLTNFVPVLGDAWALMRGPQSIACVLNFGWQLIEARLASGIGEWYGVFNAAPKVVDLLTSYRPERMGVVGLHRIPVTSFQAIQVALPDTTFVPLDAEVGRLRRQKTPLEIALLREACRMTDAAFDAIRMELRPGLTEYEVAARIVYLMQSQGARLSFEPTVVGGTEKPIPIRMPTGRKLQAGDSVMIDIGAEVQGYQADATRTYVLGEPNPKQRKVWATILEAYDAAFAAIRPGVPCVESHRAYARIMQREGFALAHRVGHGIGLNTSFEWPSLDTEQEPFVPGMTICIEPGIYVDGSGNMKLEDDVLVTETGYELLTSSSRELVVPI